MSEIIAICNQKGGVGKTTTAINVAACLAAAEKKTLLIDLDPQGNASTGLGINKYEVEASIYDVLMRGADIKSVIQVLDLSHLSIIPSNADLVGAELELVEVVSRETKLKESLTAIQDSYEYIIIDCPPSLGLLTLNALTAARSVLIPVQCEYYAMEGMADLQRTIGLVQKSLNTSLRVRGIVLTMFDPRNNLSRQVTEEVRQYFGDVVFESVVPRNVRLSEAPSYGKPIILYDVNSKGAASYLALAQEIIQAEGAIVNNINVLGGSNDAATTSSR
jgi:chromosome partitioning protein